MTADDEVRDKRSRGVVAARTGSDEFWMIGVQ
jgi:hypothetical protein